MSNLPAELQKIYIKLSLALAPDSQIQPHPCQPRTQQQRISKHFTLLNWVLRGGDWELVKQRNKLVNF